MIIETITEKTYDEVKEAMAEEQPAKDMMQHAPITDLNDMVMHLRKMVEAGYTDEEIKSLHPELAQLFTTGQNEE